MRSKERITLSFLPFLRGGLMVMLIGFLFACSEEKPLGYYEHTDGFSMVLPDGWSYEEDVSGASVVIRKGEEDSAVSTITVVMRDLPVEADNNMFADLNFREASVVEGYTAMRNEEIVVDSDSLPVLVYAYKQGDEWRQGMLTSIVAEDDDDKRGFVILCSSTSGKLEGDKAEYRAIVESFKREE